MNTTANAGLIGFLVVMALVIVCGGLFYAMTRSLEKVPETFDPQDGPESGDTP